MGGKSDHEERLETRDERLLFKPAVLPDGYDPSNPNIQDNESHKKQDRSNASSVISTTVGDDIKGLQERWKPLQKALSAPDISNYVARQIEIESISGTAFLLIPVLIIAGAATYFSLPVEPAAHNIPAAIAVCLGLRIAVRNAPPAIKYLVNAGLIFVCAMGLGQLRTTYIGTQMLGSEVTTNLTGRIVAIEHRANGSVRYTLDIMQTQRPRLRYAPKRVRATARKPVANAKIGAGLRGVVRLRPPSGPSRPGGFDFAFYNYFQGLGANGFFMGQPKLAVVDNVLGWKSIPQYIEAGRHWLGNHISSQTNTQASSVSAALITGDKARISDEINEVLRRSGLAHILSISGLHMALVAGTIMFSIRLILATRPNTGQKKPTKKIAAICGFVAIAVYLFLAGASVATQRSFVMLAVMLGALMSDRAALTMRNLAIAAIIVCLIAPDAVLGPSFQMSFSATLALIAAYGAWQASKRNQSYKTETLMRGLIRRSLTFFGGLSITSIIAGTATGIYAAYHFQRVAVLGLVGNLAAMPIVSIVTMPSAILGTLLIPIGLDGYVFAAMNWSVDAVIHIARSVTEISPNGNTGAMSNSAVLLLSASLLSICLLKSHLRFVGLLLLLPPFFLGVDKPRPAFVISEDARLIAYLPESDMIVVNRSRPSRFIMEQWQAAYRADTVVKPSEPGTEQTRFVCISKVYCSISTADRDLHWVADAEGLKNASDSMCSASSILVLAYAPKPTICKGRDQPGALITAQDLALFGSAEIYIPDTTSRGHTVEVRHAVGRVGDKSSLRPWHAHRQYSRSARNLAPNRR